MRINKIDNIFQVYNKNSGVKKINSKEMSKDMDEIKISSKAIEFQYALQKVKDVEEMRMDKVEDIKNRIKSGAYNIEGNKIAEKILESINFNKKI